MDLRLKIKRVNSPLFFSVKFRFGGRKMTIRSLILLIFLVSCASRQKVVIKDKPLSLSERLDRCVKQYLLMDLKPADALNICTTIYKQR